MPVHAPFAYTDRCRRLHQPLFQWPEPTSAYSLQSSYDANGNLTSDGLWNYTWDAENRLTAAESRSGVPAASRQRLTFRYDSQNRRIFKQAESNWVHVRGVVNRPLAERLAVLRAHTWSSYPGYSGVGARFDLVEEGPMLALVDGKGEARRSAYREFVENGLREPDENFAGEMWRSPRSIGGEKFRGWVDDLYARQVQGHAHKEDVTFRAEARKRLSAKRVEEVVASACGLRPAELQTHRRASWTKGLAGLMLVKYANLNQREVAVRLGLTTGSGVSYQIRKLQREMGSNAELRQLIARTTKALDTASEK